MEAIQHIINELSPLLQQYGYFILALAIAIEGIGIPAPGQSLLIVASLLASQGTMSLTNVLLVSGVSSVVGNTCGYFLGKKFGHFFIRKKWLKPKTLNKIHSFIDKYGLLALILSRFIEGVKQFICLGCGVAQMPFRYFFIGNVLAVSIWLFCFSWAPAYFYGEIGHIINFYHTYQTEFWVAGCSLLAIIILLFALKIRKKNFKS
ncbi:DedA family protein [Vibrio sp. SS-MA-C1-2]|uniref:DedA family protein n=1 Tax=Vibrio sp. SS-MA-C1-2 TaxID=2908646 RepID=UPI001F28476F|nr:DedA family protein [Vibrio sp. SS-MA-C1-2]UJF18093.1 DedA family protein [Vibrio sp. SS-MA-C1-2]